MTAAADALVVTQPSVSSAIGALSRELGCKLFERVGRGIRLTDAGSAFAPYAEDVIGLLERGCEAAREAAAVAACSLRIAAVTTAAESFVPPLMHAFSGQHPEIELALIVGNRQTVLDAVLSHAVDVAISGRPPIDERLPAEPLVDNEIACVVAPDDPLAAGPAIGSTPLSGRTWLLREQGSGTRALVEQYLLDRGLTPSTLTLGSNGAIRQAVRAGLGVSLLSRAAVQAELDAGLLAEVRLADGPPTRPWFLLRSAVGQPREAVQQFSAFVLAHARPGSAQARPLASGDRAPNSQTISDT